MTILATGRGVPRDRSEIIETLMRMVVPVRHEFKQSIDVTRALSDRDYARSILELASSSKNDQVRKNATLLQNMILGPRTAPANLQAAAQQPDDQAEAQKRRNETIDKYRTGLR